MILDSNIQIVNICLLYGMLPSVLFHPYTLIQGGLKQGCITACLYYKSAHTRVSVAVAVIVNAARHSSTSARPLSGHINHTNCSRAPWPAPKLYSLNPNIPLIGCHTCAKLSLHWWIQTYQRGRHGEEETVWEDILGIFFSGKMNGELNLYSPLQYSSTYS